MKEKTLTETKNILIDKYTKLIDLLLNKIFNQTAIISKNIEYLNTYLDHYKGAPDLIINAFNRVNTIKYGQEYLDFLSKKLAYFETFESQLMTIEKYLPSTADSETELLDYSVTLDDIAKMVCIDDISNNEDFNKLLNDINEMLRVMNTIE